MSGTGNSPGSCAVIRAWWCTKRPTRAISTRDAVADPIEALVCDASFIGLATLLPAPLALCVTGAWAIALIKPQFEAGAALVGGKGVVRDPAVHQAVCERVTAWWAGLPGWTVAGVVESPITGPEGNKEFLLGARFIGAA